jgi:hypothetical protein
VRDPTGGNGIELTMHVNGDALTIDRTVTNGDVLGPGLAGIHAATSGDMKTAPPTVLFKLFLVERDKD